VFFDNTYMYPRTAAPQTEETAFEPVGRKSRVRAQLATTLLQAMRTGQVDAMICRAPEFYGPGQTKSLTNSSIFDRIRRGRRALVPLDADTLRTLIWTPDASRAMALLGNTPDAYGQTWHLPCDDDRLSYRGMVETSAGVLHRRVGYRTVPAIAYRLGGLFNKDVKEAEELLPRYRQDNIFESTKFRQRFPDFAVTSYATGIRTILR
jgi:nucleoside-diphosphate-sugar epimerase